MLGPLRPTWLSTSEAPRNSMDCRGRCDSYMQANERRLIREISKSARRLFSAASQKEADGFRLPQWGGGGGNAKPSAAAAMRYRAREETRPGCLV